MTYQEACQDIFRLEEEIRILETRQKQTEGELDEKKKEAQEYKTSLYREQADVEKLEKMTFTRLLAKINGSYEEKHKKEYQEYLNAKNRLDDWNCQIEEQRKLLQRYQNEIYRLKREKKEKEIHIREDYPEGQALAAEEEEKRRKLLRTQKELGEALDAAIQVRVYANQACEKFSSADSFAVWDMLGGGVISDIAKYSSLDEGLEIIHRMEAASKRLQKELNDVDVLFSGEIDSVSGSTRFWDIAFDNLFSDWNVRGKIKENLEKTRQYCTQLDELIANLQQKQNVVAKNLKDLED